MLQSIKLHLQDQVELVAGGLNLLPMADNVAQPFAKRMAAFEWWQKFGAGAPGLNELATKLLSQPGPACASEIHWSQQFLSLAHAEQLRPQPPAVQPPHARGVLQIWCMSSAISGCLTRSIVVRRLSTACGMWMSQMTSPL